MNKTSHLLNKSLAVFMSLLLVFSFLLPAIDANAASQQQKTAEMLTVDELQRKVNDSIEQLITYYENNPPVGNSSPSDYWIFSALWGVDQNLKEFPWKDGNHPWKEDSFWTKSLVEKMGNSNEDAGIIIGATLLEQDPRKFGTRNIIQDLTDRQKEDGSFFSIWGESWAMIALDLVEASYDREKHLEYILKQQNPNGLFGDLSATGWLLTALAPYVDEHSDVQQAVQQAVKAIHESSEEKGEIAGDWGANANDAAAVLMGLTAVGEDLFSEKWTINGTNVVEQFIDTYQQEDGSFWWQEESAGAVGMASEQSLLALATIQKGESIFVHLKQQSLVGSQTNVSLQVEGINDTLLVEKQFKVLTEEKTTAFDATKQGLNQADISLVENGGFVSEIAGEKTATFGGWDGWQYKVNNHSPSVGANDYEVKDGDKIVWFYGNVGDLYKGEKSADDVEKLTLDPTIKVNSKLYAGDDIQVEVTATYDVYDKNFELEQEQVQTKVKNADVKFNGEIYKTNKNGIATIPGEKAKVGTYEIRVTKDVENSYPRLLRQAKKIIISEKESDGEEPVPPVSTESVTFSVDKKAVSSDDIISSREVVLKTGDTPYTVLKRVANENNISVSASGSGDGVYVKAIDGLSEFDYGEGSGWMYSVNDTFPTVSAGSYVLKDGDDIRWQYTTDLGSDVGDGSGSGSGEEMPDRHPEATDKVVSDKKDESISISSDEKELYIQTENSNEKVTNIITLKFQQTKLPKIEAIRGKTILEIPHNIEIQSKWDRNLQLPRDLSVDEKEVKDKISATLDIDQTPTITQRIKVGGDEPIQFNNYVTLTFKDQGKQDAGYINHAGEFKKIPKYTSSKQQEQDVYAFENDGNLIIKTKHFTEFLAYEVEKSSIELPKLQPIIDNAAKWMLENRDFSTYDEFTDWDVLALARAGKETPKNYYPIIEKHVKEQKGEFRLVTDYERIALTVMALGHDPTDIAGYDFIEKVYNNDRLTNQGTNGALFALLTLNAQNFEVPQNANWTRARLIAWILEQQNADGGFPLSRVLEGESDVDVTAMVLQALANDQDQKEVKEATNRALAWISKQQFKNGGFLVRAEENSESIAQVIIALTSLGVPLDDARFVKADGDLLTAFTSFINKDGGISHEKGEPSNYMGTQQGLLALTAYSRYLEKENDLYDMTDVERVEVPEEKIPFTDIDSNHFAYDEIMSLVDEGVINGYRDGTFRPDDKLIRGQAAILFTGALDLTVPNHPVGFEELPKSSTFYEAAHATKASGVFAGKKNGTFGIQEELTREQMASVLVRAFKLKGNEKEVPFKDLEKVSRLHREDVKIIYQNDIAAGRSNGTFDPQSSVSRAQFSAFLYRALEK